MTTLRRLLVDRLLRAFGRGGVAAASRRRRDRLRALGRGGVAAASPWDRQASKVGRQRRRPLAESRRVHRRRAFSARPRYDAVGTYDAIGLCDGAYDIEAVGAYDGAYDIEAVGAYDGAYNIEAVGAYDGAYDTVAVGAYVREGEAGGKTGAGEGMKTGGACAGSRGLAADALGTTGFGSLARSRPRRGVSRGYSVGGSTEDAARSASPNPASAKLSEAA